MPVRVPAVGELEASLVNETVAAAAPLACGVNVTVKFKLFPAAMVTGNARPLTKNSDGLVPPITTEDSFTFPPVAVRVPVCWLLRPTTTLPTLIGFGLTPNMLCVAATADPVSGTLTFGFEPSDVTDTLPPKLPADCGENVTLNDVLCPGINVTGVLMPETLNPVPFALT